MITFHISTQEFLSTKGLRGKFGGNFMGITVRQSIILIPIIQLKKEIWPDHYIEYCCMMFHWLGTVGDTIEVGNFDPKIATFWLDSGNHMFNCFISHLNQRLLHLFVGLLSFLNQQIIDWKVYSSRAVVLRYFQTPLFIQNCSSANIFCCLKLHFFLSIKQIWHN